MSCCPKSYWCTPSGVVGVDADESGVAPPPEDATAGPYATEEEALAVCTGEEVTTCDVCPLTYRTWFTVSIENVTGELIAGTKTMPMGEADPDVCTIGSQAGLFPTNHLFSFFGTGYYPGIQIYFNGYSTVGGWHVHWMPWAQNQDLHNHFMKWVDLNPDYFHWMPGPWVFSPQTIRTIDPIPCNSDLYPERTYIGRIAIANHADTITWGEGDLYIS